MSADDPRAEHEQAHRQHLALLQTWNPRAHLVSRADASGPGLQRHLDEALLALSHLPASGTIVDLGSGGGFPGLVWAVERPGSRVVLIEANARKAAFLRECRHRLGLAAVEVVEEHVTSAERIASLEPAILTTRATGLNDLLLEAASCLGDLQPVVLVFFPARGDVGLIRKAEALGFMTRVDISLGADRGRLLVAGSA